MSRSFFLLVALATISPSFISLAFADTLPQDQSTRSTSSYSSVANQPDLISIGSGYVDFDKNESNDPKTHAVDFRGEYRWGSVLWQTNNNVFDFGIRPIAGAEATSRAQLYGFGGLAFDFLFWKHFVLTPSEAAGLYDNGNARPLGSFVEFRSQIEAGWRFDNNMRLTAYLSHTSNAGLTRQNPGMEIAGFYLHVPVNCLFGK